MKNILKDLLETAIDQLFGTEEPFREWKLVLSRKAFEKMAEWNLSEETLKLTYQIGEQTPKGNGVYQIIRKYQYYFVGIWHVEEYRPVKRTRRVEKIAFVITCWKGSVRAQGSPRSLSVRNEVVLNYEC